MNRISYENRADKRTGQRAGQIGIPLLVSLALLTVTVGVSITAVGVNESGSYQNLVSSYKALSYAESGARDALLRIANNYKVVTSGGSDCGSLNTDGAAPCYKIDFTSDSTGCTSPHNGCARVKIASATSPKTITVEGRSGGFTRKIQVTVTLSTNTAYLNMIKHVAWQEL